MRKKTVLLTGGTGYIGSHTAVALADAGYEPILLDNFSNSQPAVVDRLHRIVGRPLVCEVGDVLDTSWLQFVIDAYAVDAVVHLAGLKAVGESMACPLKYYRTNVGGTVSLLEAMDVVGCRHVVFSSSATVYGDPASSPITEDFPRKPSNPYGLTKAACEDVVAALCSADARWRSGVLRYFNPVGAHPSGLIGDDPVGIPNNLMPFVAQVAAGCRNFLSIYGDDYDTADGTGVRDYIHVQDLARGHVAAVQALLGGAENFTVNLGTGRGHSVMEVLRTFETSSGRTVPFRIAPRRPGDVAAYHADVARAWELLRWRATLGLPEMCTDAWRWQHRQTGPQAQEPARTPAPLNLADQVSGTAGGTGCSPLGEVPSSARISTLPGQPVLQPRTAAND